MSQLFILDDQNNWSFIFSISSSSEYSGLISLKINWFDLLLLPSIFHSIRVLSQFLIALTIWTLFGRAMSLLFNTLSRFVIAFLPRSKHLLISWLQSLSAVILEPKKRKSVTTSTSPPSICHLVKGLDAMILVFLIFSFKPSLFTVSHSVVSDSL